MSFDGNYYDACKRIAALQAELVSAQERSLALADENKRLKRNSYPHMCRMDHQQIGHNDSEHERCPLCRALGAGEAVQELADAAMAENKRLRDALREIASYQGDDSQLDINAKNMREAARDALTSCGDERHVFNHQRDCGLTNDVGTCECPQPAAPDTPRAEMEGEA